MRLQHPISQVVASQKGGVGKTAVTSSIITIVHLALLRTHWLRGGRLPRTLGVDGDETAALSRYFGAPDNGGPRRPPSIVELLEAKRGLEATDVIRRDALGIPGLDVLPSDGRAAQLNEILSPMKFREARLQRALRTVRNDYDYIVFDTPGSLGLVTVNALVCADRVAIPMSMQDGNSAVGARNLMAEILQLRTDAGLRLSVNGIFRVRADPRAICFRSLEREAAGMLEAGLPVSDTVVRERAEWQQATTGTVPLVLLRPSSDGAADAVRLARELFPDLAPAIPFPSEIRGLVRDIRVRAADLSEVVAA